MEIQIKDQDGNVTATVTLPDNATPEQIAAAQNAVTGGQVQDPTPTQFEADKAKYLKRAENKDILIAEMDAENMGRVKNGTWTSSQLISLTTDAQLIEIINDINTLSFEIAVQKIPSITNVLITDEIKAGWVAKLQTYF